MNLYTWWFNCYGYLSYPDGQNVRKSAFNRCLDTFAYHQSHRSGYNVVSTSSPRNFDLVKAYGADVVFDYNSPTCALPTCASSPTTSSTLSTSYRIPLRQKSAPMPCQQIARFGNPYTAPFYSNWQSCLVMTWRIHSRLHIPSPEKATRGLSVFSLLPKISSSVRSLPGSLRSCLSRAGSSSILLS